MQAEGMHHGNAPLLHGGGGQSGETDHVPGCVDIGDGGLIFFVHQHQTALPEGHTQRFEPETQHVALPAGRE